MAMFLLTYSDESHAEGIRARASEKDIPIKEVSPSCYALVSKTIVTPKEMYEHLEIQDGEFGQLVIVKFDSYWGFHDSGLWAWLQGHGGSL